MFTEELSIIKDAEERADLLKKEAKVQAKVMIEKANTEAGKIINRAEEDAKDCLEALLREGRDTAQTEYDKTIEQAEALCSRMGSDASKMQDKVVEFIVERIVKASVNN